MCRGGKAGQFLITLALLFSIALSANAFAEDRKRAVDIGMNGHIAKPIDVEKTEKVIHLVLNKQKNEK